MEMAFARSASVGELFLVSATRAKPDKFAATAWSTEFTTLDNVGYPLLS